MTSSAVLCLVALRKESVDRNCDDVADLCYFHRSLSARRAWIEIITVIKPPIGCVVALRKESVDRNRNSIKRCLMSVVALRKESVDRNPVGAGSLIILGGSLSARRAWIEIAPVVSACNFSSRRSPQGERG